MKDKITKIRLIKHDLQCHCGGEMAHTGLVLMTYPAQYEMQCTTCGAKATTNKDYPWYEEIEE